MANNYLITGAKGVGKSTLLARLLRELDLKAAGFAVSRIKAADGRPLLFELRQAADLKEKGAEALIKKAEPDFSAVELVEEDQKEAARCQETLEFFEGAAKTLKLSAGADDSLRLLRYQKIFAYRENTADKFIIKADIFDNLGVELLRQAGEIVVFDELGHFELEAQKFKKEVFSLLSSEKIVIGVIKAESNPFLDEIRQRNDLSLYQLKEYDKQERTEIFNKLLENLKNIGAEK